MLVQVDWNGKVALIESAQAMGIQRYIFFSIHECEKHPEVPLMEIKRCTEKYLQDQTSLNFTTIRLCGFMQVHSTHNAGVDSCRCFLRTILVQIHTGTQYTPCLQYT